MGRPSNREEALAALRASLAKGKIIVGAGAGKWEPRDAPIFLLSPLLGPRLGRATYPCLKFFEDDKTDEKTIIITAVKPMYCIDHPVYKQASVSQPSSLRPGAAT